MSFFGLMESFVRQYFRNPATIIVSLLLFCLEFAPNLYLLANTFPCIDILWFSHMFWLPVLCCLDDGVPTSTGFVWKAAGDHDGAVRCLEAVLRAEQAELLGLCEWFQETKDVEENGRNRANPI